jgi:acetolactate synthase I/II/III large subunit
MEEPNELAIYGRTFGPRQGEVRWDVVAQGLCCHGEYAEKLEDVAPAVRRAKQTAGPSVVCLRTDHDANLAIPAEMMSRFFEVYAGPALEPATAVA